MGTQSRHLGKRQGSRPTKGLSASVSAIALLCGLACTVSTTSAQENTGAAVSARGNVAFNIPAQNLNSAILAFADRSGIQVFYDVSRVSGLRSAAVSGSYSNEEALSRLLAGTGVSYTFSSANRVSLNVPGTTDGAALRSDGSTVLDTITVQTQGAVTEGTGAYTADWMRTANGLALSQKDTPQSTSVVTRQMMDDRNENSIKDVLENATGITTNQAETDGFNFYSRGFVIDNYQYDGVPTTLDATYQYGDGVADTIIYDHVEVVRGATGLLTSVGEPGASINFIRKRPTDEFQGSITGLIGINQNYRTELDLSGPLNSDGSVRGRFVGALQTKEDTIDFYSNDKNVFYGVVEADVGDSTRVTIGASRQETNAEGTMWGGLPAFNNNGELIDWAKGSGLGTDWTGWDTVATDIFSSIDHTFDNGWEAHVSYSYQKNKFDAPLLFLYGNPDPTTGLGLSALGAHFIGEREQHALNARLNGDYELFGQTHEFVVGAYASQAKGHIDRYAPTGAMATVGDVFNWDPSYAAPVWSTTPMATWDTEVRQAAIYGATRINATDQLAITLGARVNYWDGFNDNTYNFYDYKFSGVVSPYAGVSYELTDQLTAYASYTSIYKPQQFEDINGKYLDPVYGHNYEVGLKGSFLDDRLKASAAIFQTNQKDLAEYVGYDAVTQRSYYRSIDGTTTRGFELEVAGEVLDGWNVFGGFTYRSSKDNLGNKVQTFQPQSVLKLGSTYELTGVLDGLTIGGAMRWQSKTENLANYSSTPASITQDPYAVFDLMASYEFDEQTSLKVNVSNVFDKRYYRTMGFYDSVFYGDGRAATVTLKRTF